MTRALCAEAAGLTETLGEGAGVVASSAGAAMQMNAPQLANELARLTTLRTGKYPSALEQRWWRLFRRNLPFLVDTRAQAANLTRALPLAFDLWDMSLSDHRQRVFDDRFAGYGKLRYN